MRRYRSVWLCQLRRYLQGLVETGKLDAVEGGYALPVRS